MTLARTRLTSQQIATPSLRTPAEVVQHMGALQAQDYPGALWSIGLRLAPDSDYANETAVEMAAATGQIVRTWPMRGTLHFVHPADLRAFLATTALRALDKAAHRRRTLELDDATLARARDLITGWLQGGRARTRAELVTLLDEASIATAGQRGIHILGSLAQSGVLVFGPRQGKSFTFALTDEFVPPTPRLDRDEALATIARRYFAGHGPASVPDFVWWTGLTTSDCRRAIQAAGDALVQTSAKPALWAANPPPAPAAPNSVHLLPGFDEYLLGYADRSAMLAPEHAARTQPGGNGVFRPVLVVDGQVRGTWQRIINKKSATLALSPFPPLAITDLDFATRTALDAAAASYGRFLGLPIAVREG